MLAAYENKISARWLAWLSSCLCGILLVAVWGCFTPPTFIQHFNRTKLETTPAVEVFVPPPQIENPPAVTPEVVNPEPAPTSPTVAIPSLPAIADAVPAINLPTTPSLVALKPFEGVSSPTIQSLQPSAFNPNQSGGTFPAPPYPRWARQQSMQGRLELLVEVAADGHITSLKVKESSGFNLLDQHVVDWVQSRWSWLQGKTRLYVIPFIFELQ